jgi:hypothetical protein
MFATKVTQLFILFRIWKDGGSGSSSQGDYAAAAPAEAPAEAPTDAGFMLL